MGIKDMRLRHVEFPAEILDKHVTILEKLIIWVKPWSILGQFLGYALN